MHGYPTELEIKSNDWPNGLDDDAPGNEKHFLSRGFLLGPPAEIFPYRGMASDDYYDAEEERADPITNAPLQDPNGGTVYFDTTDKEQLGVIFSATAGQTLNTEFAAFAFQARDPVTERYLDQMRIVTSIALANVFDVDEDDLPGEQTMTIGEALTGFVTAQESKWCEPGETFPHRLEGAAGGDGDWAREALAFGFHVENSYWGVCRIWSRLWLVTK